MCNEREIQSKRDGTIGIVCANRPFKLIYAVFFPASAAHIYLFSASDDKVQIKLSSSRLYAIIYRENIRIQGKSVIGATWSFSWWLSRFMDADHLAHSRDFDGFFYNIFLFLVAVPAKLVILNICFVYHIRN